MAYTIQIAHPSILKEIESWPAEAQADFAHVADLMADLGPRLKAPHSYAIGAGLLEVVVGGRDSDARVVYGRAEDTIVFVDAFRAPTRSNREDPRLVTSHRRLAQARKVARGQQPGRAAHDFAPLPYDPVTFRARASRLNGFAAAHAALAERYLIARSFVVARTRAGLTQAEVAQRMGTAASAVSRLEAADGVHSPRLATLVKYAEALNADLHIELKERPAPQP